MPEAGPVLPKAADAGAGPGDVPAPRPSRGPWGILLVLVAAYVAGASLLSSVRFWGLFAGTWDLGIFQQSLWSGFHTGTLYNAPNYESYFAPSFLVVHPSLLLYPLSLVYGAIPTPYCLFVLQAAVVGVAAIPLYYLALDLSASPWRSLLAAGLYLVWAPLLGGNLYDFHLEAFLPLELFTFFLLWRRQKYRWAAIPAAFAVITLEVAPFLLAAVALFFGLPSFRRIAREVEGSGVRRFLSRSVLGPRLRSWWAQREVRAAVVLFVVSMLAYVALRVVEVYYGGLGRGTPGLSLADKIAGQSGLGISLAAFPVDLRDKVTYWLLAYGLVAFLPLRALRTALLAIPWLVFTFFSAVPALVEVGYQYAFVLAFSLFVAVAYGLAEPLPVPRPHSQASEPSREDPRPSPVRRRKPVSVWVVVIAVAVGANVLLSPADPLLQNNPSFGTGYRLSYAPAAGFNSVVRIAGLIGPTDPVVASTYLFPFVANDPNAYSFLYFNGTLPGLPFSPTRLPEYLFVDQSEVQDVPSWLAQEVYNGTGYALRAAAATGPPSPIGPVLLLQLGYTGAPLFLGLNPFPSTYYHGRSLDIGPGVNVVPDPNSTFGSSIERPAGSPGVMWYGPYVLLTPGNYTVDVSLRTSVPNGAFAPPGATDVFNLSADAWGLPKVYNRSLNFSQVNSPGWTVFQFSLTVTIPWVDFEVSGSPTRAGVPLVTFLNYVAIVG